MTPRPPHGTGRPWIEYYRTLPRADQITCWILIAAIPFFVGGALWAAYKSLLAIQ